jgi:hypothetical protein
MAGEWPNRHVEIRRTSDGGGTWKASIVGRAKYTDWPLAPEVSLSFRDSQNGSATIVDPPQHHNGHLMTTWIYRTNDGGVTWQIVRTRKVCTSPSTGCRGG